MSLLFVLCLCLITHFTSALSYEEAGLENVVVSLLQQISELKEKTENQMDALRNAMDAMKKEQVKLKEAHDIDKSYLRNELEEIKTQQVELRANVDLLNSKLNAQNRNVGNTIPDADDVSPATPLIADDVTVYGTEENVTKYKNESFHTNVGDVSSSTRRKPDVTPKGKEDKRGELKTEQSQNMNAQRIRRSVENKVAFFAYLRYQANNLGAFQNIVFDNVVTNIGNAYNWRHGIFIAPVNGTYVFSFTLMAVGSMTWGHFVVNRQVVAKVELVEKNASSQTIVVTLKAGDDVSVQNTYTDRTLIGDKYSTFSGFLLYEGAASNVIAG